MVKINIINLFLKGKRSVVKLKLEINNGDSINFGINWIKNYAFALFVSKTWCDVMRQMCSPLTHLKCNVSSVGDSSSSLTCCWVTNCCWVAGGSKCAFLAVRSVVARWCLPAAAAFDDLDAPRFESKVSGGNLCGSAISPAWIIWRLRCASSAWTHTNSNR